jgi:hypothetical protein
MSLSLARVHDPAWLRSDRLVVGESAPRLDDGLFGVPLVSDMLARSPALRPGPVPGPIALNPFASVDAPMVQMQRLSAKYGVCPQADVKAWQKALVTAIITAEARAQGISPALPLSVAYHESRLQMWTDPRTGTIVHNDNMRNGSLSSTDFGVMQINNKAHARAFPQVANDMEANIRYGVSLLARIDRKYGQDLGLGLGRWDAVYVVYGLGHLPKTDSEWAWSRRIANQFQDILPKFR